MLEMARRQPDTVDEVGRHAGFDYVLRHNRYAHWLAYVRLPEGHPWAVSADGDGDPDCHGGVTYVGRDDEAHGWWKGWDYGHGFDEPDPILVARLGPTYRDGLGIPDWGNLDGGVVHTMETVRAEAESVCGQARDAMTAAGRDTVAKMLAHAILNGDTSAADALVDWWLEHRRGGQ